MITTSLAFADARSDYGYLSQFREMLKSENLCIDDLEDIPGILQVAIYEGKIIGGYGLEIFGDEALFRSLIVSEELRGMGLGIEIMKEAFNQSKNYEIKTLYLLTTTADKFFLRHGFKVIERNSVPESIGGTTEFISFCPDTAVCMNKNL